MPEGIKNKQANSVSKNIRVQDSKREAGYKYQINIEMCNVLMCKQFWYACEYALISIQFFF